MKQVAVKNKRINIWQYQFILARRLAWWSMGSFSLGVILFWMEPLLRGFGIQTFVWGLINAARAVAGALLTTKRRSKLSDPAATEAVQKEADQLWKRLWWLVLLDSVCVLVGVVLAFSLGRQDAWWRGTGIGVVVQGLFLLGFDWYHAKDVPVIEKG